eukprot:8291756-Alexandrium_andersonii.AAC.1
MRAGMRAGMRAASKQQAGVFEPHQRGTPGAHQLCKCRSVRAAAAISLSQRAEARSGGCSCI